MPALPPEMVKSEGFWIEPLTLASDTPPVPAPPTMFEAKLKLPPFLNSTDPEAAVAVALSALIWFTAASRNTPETVIASRVPAVIGLVLFWKISWLLRI